MNSILVIDGGGRGNAIAHRLTTSPAVEDVYVTPGNAGVYEYGGENRPLPDGTKRERIPAVIEHVEAEDVDLAVPGSEGWLSAGIVDAFHEETDVPVLGPTRRAATLESSKCDTKDYLDDIGVPVPTYRNFDDAAAAKDWAREWYDERDADLVPKADGIAAGKGAFVCDSLEETLTAIETITGDAFNEEYDGAGERLEIEERLRGEELSFFAITDGETVRPFGTARDYKRRYANPDGALIDQYFDGINPNTGGMGAYSPHDLGEDIEDRIMTEIADPTVANLDMDYTGILHFVLMVVEEPDGLQPYVLEINVRDGDPEAQARLPRLETDLFEVYHAAATGSLADVDVEWRDDYCVGVCAVSGPPYKDGERVGAGYPGTYLSKQPIFPRGRPDERIGREGVGEYVEGTVYHNGTDLHENTEGTPFLRSRGGRVLTFTTTGETLEAAREQAYEDLDEVFFSFMAYRDDIGEE
ncbi:MAG: phosphoribosylamine--glycine ligase [Halanaeroarchaeum sp.]